MCDCAHTNTHTGAWKQGWRKASLHIFSRRAYGAAKHSAKTPSIMKAVPEEGELAEGGHGVFGVGVDGNGEKAPLVKGLSNSSELGMGKHASSQQLQQQAGGRGSGSGGATASAAGGGAPGAYNISVYGGVGGAGVGPLPGGLLQQQGEIGFQSVELGSTIQMERGSEEERSGLLADAPLGHNL